MIDFVKDLWSDGWVGKAIIAGIVVVIIALPFGIYAAAKAHAEWEANCKDMGGHVVDHTSHSTGTTIDSNGKPVTTTNSETTYYCLNDDGGIIDIE